MRGAYQIAQRRSTAFSRDLAEFLTVKGQLLLPMVEPIEQAECAVDELVDVVGRAPTEAILVRHSRPLSLLQETTAHYSGRQTGSYLARITQDPPES